jgi:[protein-PII] uridylyltransferase
VGDVTTWKASLFQELYEKAFNVLERGEFQQEASSERVRAVVSRVSALLEDELPSDQVQNELKAMPVRLLLSNPAPLIAEQTRLLLGLDIQTS